MPTATVPPIRRGAAQRLGLRLPRVVAVSTDQVRKEFDAKLLRGVDRRAALADAYRAFGWGEHDVAEQLGAVLGHLDGCRMPVSFDAECACVPPAGASNA